MSKMSITRALAEIKRIDDRISRGLNVPFVSVTVGKDTQQRIQNGTVSVPDATNAIKGAFDSIDTMFKQRAQIKAAIVLSNATTKVKVGPVEMSVAEAIELKRSVITKKTYVNTLRNQFTQANALVAKLNTDLEATIESNLKMVYGNDKGKADPTAYESIAKPQLQAKAPALLDPCDIAKKISALDEEISLIETELDYTLSESNSRTEIEI